MPPKSTDQAGQVTQADGGALQALGLEPEDIAALKRNGSITRERRGRNTVIFKLRYRVGECQHVKYLGTDECGVERIRGELNDLQASHRRGRQLRHLDVEARALLRAMKDELGVHLEQAGLKFHGRAIRRPRQQIGATNYSSSNS